MKVNKEEILGMLVALELYLSKDHEAEWKQWDTQTRHISDVVGSVPGAQTEYFVPEIANHVPTLRITWDQNRIHLTANEVKARLRQGHPSIETGGGRDDVTVAVWMMRAGEERIVARRIREELEEAST
jgi:L-seryl-tRNA(Ser) seleniumtransferase